MDLQRQFRLEDAADQRSRMDLSNDNTRWMQSFDYQTTLMRRDFAREDYQFNTQMRSLSYGWNMEDLDEQIRRSSGYERGQLIKQRDRATSPITCKAARPSSSSNDRKSCGSGKMNATRGASSSTSR